MLERHYRLHSRRCFENCRKHSDINLWWLLRRVLIPIEGWEISWAVSTNIRRRRGFPSTSWLSRSCSLYRQALKWNKVWFKLRSGQAPRLHCWHRISHQGMGWRHHSTQEGSESCFDMSSRVCLRRPRSAWSHPSRVYPGLWGRTYRLYEAVSDYWALFRIKLLNNNWVESITEH